MLVYLGMPRKPMWIGKSGSSRRWGQRSNRTGCAEQVIEKKNTLSVKES